MTQDEIIEMAKDIANHGTYASGEIIYTFYLEQLEAFAKLVAAKEREACAKVCEELPAPDIYSDTDKSMWDVTCIDCADAIRARGQA
jgi:hypothetical protein